jgi:hypothetical protein
MKTESFVARRSPGQGTKNVIDDWVARIVLKDIPGPNGIPLMHTKWRLLLNDTVIATGETDEHGRVAFLSAPKPDKTYKLEYPGRVLEIRKQPLDRISSVKGLQQRLASLGYNPGPADGKHGPRTRTALMDFQTDCGLTVDGIYGPKSQDKLLETFGD